MADQWWANDKTVTPANELRPARSAVEFAPPQQPMSPAQAAGLDFEAQRIDLQRKNQEEAEAERQRKRRELTEGQSKALGFYQRMRASNVEFDRLGLDPQGYEELFAQRKAPNFSRIALSDERRAQLDAIENFIAAELRQESGAAIAESEFDKMARIFFPQPGAGPKEIEQKRVQRELAIRGFRTLSGEYGAEQADKNLRDLGFIDEQGNPVAPQQPGPDGRIVTAPGTTQGAVMGAVQGGQPILTDDDRKAGTAIQDAWNRTGNPDEVIAVASQFGRTLRPEDIEFLRANVGKPVNIQANPTGTPTATQEAIGEIVATPVGESMAAAGLGAANAASLGLLDELAPVLGLDPQRVQMAKDYLRQKAPVSSLAGEIGGGLIPAAGAIGAAGKLLAGTRAAGAAPVIGEGAFGGALGAGEAPEGERLQAGAMGAAVGAGAGALGQRLFGGPRGGPDGGVPPAAPMGGPSDVGVNAAMAASGGRVSGGAAATPDAVVRYAAASDLPVPVELMPFQQSRNFAANQRAHELAKNNEVGGPLREKFSAQQARLAQNFDAFLEKTGAEIWKGAEERGVRVTGALEKMAAQDKARVRTLYKQAEKSADGKTVVPLADPVTVRMGDDDVTTSLVQYLNEQPVGVPSSSVTDAARQIALRLGIVGKDEAGNIVPKDPTVAGLEKFRREISGIASPVEPNAIRQETILKRITDAHTEPVATGAYAKARAARREVAQKYESVSTIAQLLGTKRNTPERVIAAEKVMDRLFSGTTSVANLRALKGLLTGEGGDPQAWAEVQGALVSRIQRAAYPKGSVADEAGQKTMLPSGLKGIVQELDENGKLDAIFEPEIARGFRTLAEVVEIIEPPRGTQNYSNTTSAADNRFGAMIGNATDALLSLLSVGIPVPTGATNKILEPVRKALKERPLKKEVQQLIGEPTQ